MGFIVIEWSVNYRVGKKTSTDEFRSEVKDRELTELE